VTYWPRTSWRPARAFLTAALILAIAQAAIPSCVHWVSKDLYSALSGQIGPPRAFEPSPSPILSGAQDVVIIGLVLIVAALQGGKPRDVLGLRPVPGGALSAMNLAGLAFLAIVPVDYLISLAHPRPIAILAIAPQAWLRPQWPWINLVTSTFGTAFSQELLFRGFLLSGLANSSLGFWPAAIIANAAWTFSTLPWTWPVLISQFVFGLFLSAAIWRSGSLWPCVLARGLNALIPALTGILLAPSLAG
jgi:membrane protease YdiL (CAAX protease family)